MLESCLQVIQHLKVELRDCFDEVRKHGPAVRYLTTCLLAKSPVSPSEEAEASPFETYLDIRQILGVTPYRSPTPSHVARVLIGSSAPTQGALPTAKLNPVAKPAQPSCRAVVGMYLYKVADQSQACRCNSVRSTPF